MTSRAVDLFELSDYYNLVERKKIGNIYKNAVLIQDNLIFKIKPDTKTDKYHFSYLINDIPVLASDINISSNCNILRIDIENKEDESILILKNSKEVIRGKIINMVVIGSGGDYSLIDIIDEHNNELSLKIKDFIIKKELSKFKKLEFVIYNQNGGVLDTINISIFYTNYINNNIEELWFINHYLYTQNDFEILRPYDKSNDKPVYITDEKLNLLTLKSNIIIKPISIGPKFLELNKLNFIDKLLYKPIQKINPFQQYGVQPVNKLLETNPVTEYDNLEKRVMISTNVLNSINGNINLSSEFENSFLISVDNKIKGKLITIVYLDLLTNNYENTNIKPQTDLLFIEKFFSTKQNILKSTLPVIPNGKVTIYGFSDNENYQEILNITNELELNSNTMLLQLGESNLINFVYKIIKIEFDKIDKTQTYKIQFTITNNSQLQSILTIKFLNCESVIILDYNSISRLEKNDYIFKSSSKSKNLIFNTLEKNQNYLLLDFILQPEMNNYFVLDVKIKIK